MDHFLSILGTETSSLERVLRRAVSLRATPEPGLLTGKTVLCLFEKPSLRTRVSFEVAARDLGAHVMSMGQGEVGLGQRESPEDVGRVLGSMVDVIVARVRDHTSLERMAAVLETGGGTRGAGGSGQAGGAGDGGVPVINGLSDRAHPAQALADVLTLMDEFSPGEPAGLAGRRVVFVGDGNNVARSLCALCLKFGVGFTLCAPEGYEFPGDFVARVQRETGGEVAVERDPGRASAGADALYCDTFVSMGQEAQRDQRVRAFAGYRVDEALVERMAEHGVVLHCLPASRGVEITDGVMDGPRSRVFAQARNRLDAQRGLLAEIAG